MFLYAKHPTEKRWIIFSEDESGKLTRALDSVGEAMRLSDIKKGNLND